MLDPHNIADRRRFSPKTEQHLIEYTADFRASLKTVETFGRFPQNVRNWCHHVA